MSFPRPLECPDHIDWDTLSHTTQRELLGRLEQLGRIDLDDDEVLFVARMLAPVRSAS